MPSGVGRREGSSVTGGRVVGTCVSGCECALCVVGHRCVLARVCLSNVFVPAHTCAGVLVLLAGVYAWVCATSVGVLVGEPGGLSVGVAVGSEVRSCVGA